MAASVEIYSGPNPDETKFSPLLPEAIKENLLLRKKLFEEKTLLFNDHIKSSLLEFLCYDPIDKERIELKFYNFLRNELHDRFVIAGGSVVTSVSSPALKSLIPQKSYSDIDFFCLTKKLTKEEIIKLVTKSIKSIMTLFDLERVEVNYHHHIVEFYQPGRRKIQLVEMRDASNVDELLNGFDLDYLKAAVIKDGDLYLLDPCRQCWISRKMRLDSSELLDTNAKPIPFRLYVKAIDKGFYLPGDVSEKGYGLTYYQYYDIRDGHNTGNRHGLEVEVYDKKEQCEAHVDFLDEYICIKTAPDKSLVWYEKIAQAIANLDPWDKTKRWTNYEQYMKEENGQAIHEEIIMEDYPVEPHVPWGMKNPDKQEKIYRVDVRKKYFYSPLCTISEIHLMKDRSLLTTKSDVLWDINKPFPVTNEKHFVKMPTFVTFDKMGITSRVGNYKTVVFPDGSEKEMKDCIKEELEGKKAYMIYCTDAYFFKESTKELWDELDRGLESARDRISMLNKDDVEERMKKLIKDRRLEFINNPRITKQYYLHLKSIQLVEDVDYEPDSCAGPCCSTISILSDIKIPFPDDVIPETGTDMKQRDEAVVGMSSVSKI